MFPCLVLTSIVQVGVVRGSDQVVLKREGDDLEVGSAGE